MCGITGVLNHDRGPVGERTLRRMTAAIAHRGPDGEGVWCGEGIGLGHRRLAIIGVGPSGAQPMSTPCGRYVVTYNGEIYNFAELRAQLRDRGCAFRTRTDTEVVLRAFETWGPRCVERFNGMFAFAVWDTIQRTLYLARDRYGIKPLYYAVVGETLLFGSEIKAMLQHPAMSVRVSLPALHEYFTFQNVFGDHTLFDGVQMLPAGHYLQVVSGKSGAPEPTRYWDFDFQPDETMDREACERETARLFEAAVQRQLVSDVPVGSYLSGGIDSGSISCVASRMVPELETFTCGFDTSSASGLELACDERDKASLLSSRYKTKHSELVLKAGDMERCISDLVWHLEDLRVGQSYPNYYAASLASRSVKVVLSGTGGDELFAGYPWRYYPSARDNVTPQDYVDKHYTYWQRLVPDELKPSFFRSELHGPMLQNHSTLDAFRRVHASGPSSTGTPEGYVNSSLYFELKTFLHGLLLVEDKLGMAHGLETRVPFLDNDLVDFAQRIPVRHKLKHLRAPERIDENAVGRKGDRYYLRTSDGKLVLRRALAQYLPREYVNAPKQGFSAPDASWFKGESVDYLRELFRRDARLYDFLERKTVQGLLDDHFSGRRNRRLLIWSFLSFEWWLRVFDPVGASG